MPTETIIASAVPMLNRAVYDREQRIAIRRGVEAAIRDAGLKMQRRFPCTESGEKRAKAEAARMQAALDAAGLGDHRVQVNRCMSVPV